MEMREKDLVEKYELYLRGWLKGKIEDSRDREEVLANILWAVVNSYPSFAGKSSLKTWVVAIAKKRLVDFYRKKKLKTVLFSRLPQLEEVASAALGPEEHVLRDELWGEIRAVMRMLGEGSGEILRLKYIEGLAVKRIAKLLKLSPKTVESRLFRARQNFVRIWKKREEK